MSLEVNSESEPERKRFPNLIPAKPGEVRNPHGRPKGSRNKLGEAFIAAMHEDFIEHGPDVIQRVRIEEPAQYLKVIASILPKELRIESADSLSEAEIDQRLRKLAEYIGLEIGDAGAAAGEAAQDKAPETLDLQAVPETK